MLVVVIDDAGGGPPPSGFPTYLSTTETAFATDTTAHNANMPATVDTGDLLIAVTVFDGSVALTTPSGWTAMTARINNPGGTALSSACYSKIADGSEGGTTVNFVTGTNEQGVVQVFRVAAGSFDATAPIDLALSANNGTTTAVAPALDASWGAEDTLWLAYYGTDGGTITVSSYPTSYTGSEYTSSSASGGVAAASVYRENNTANEAAATFTLSASAPWAAVKMAVAPAGVALAAAAILSRTTTGLTSTTTSHAVSIPAVSTGDRLVALIGNDAGGAITTPTNWTSLGQVTSGGSVNYGVFYRDFPGAAGATTVDFVTSPASRMAAIVYAFDAGTFDAAAAPEVAITDLGSVASTTITAVTPSWGSGDTVFINSLTRGATSTAQIPTNAAVNGYKTPTTVTGTGVRTFSADRIQRATSGSTAGWDFGAAAITVCAQIAVKPA